MIGLNCRSVHSCFFFLLLFVEKLIVDVCGIYRGVITGLRVNSWVFGTEENYSIYNFL